MSLRKTILKLGLSLFLSLPLVSRRVTLGTSLKTNWVKEPLWMLVLLPTGSPADLKGEQRASIFVYACSSISALVMWNSVPLT